MALAISIVADTVDYVAAPIFGIPLVGDIFDVMITSMLYTITRSKRSTLLNMAELVPVIGDLIPTYTLTTLMWMYLESRRKENRKHAIVEQ